jgi:hypothetical protein
MTEVYDIGHDDYVTKEPLPFELGRSGETAKAIKKSSNTGRGI